MLYSPRLTPSPESILACKGEVRRSATSHRKLERSGLPRQADKANEPRSSSSISVRTARRKRTVRTLCRLVANRRSLRLT